MINAKPPLEFTELGPDVTATFLENGVVCVHGLIDSAGVEHLRKWVEIAIENPAPGAQTTSTSYRIATHLWTRLDGFRDFAFDSVIARAAGVVMGSREVRMYNDTMFVKEPSAPEVTPWHQDLPYLRIDGGNNCAAWIALDPANEASGAMSYVLGSHRWGKMFRPLNFSKPDEFHKAADTYDGEAPDIDADPEQYPTVTFDLQPGDVVFHHGLMLHKAGANSSEGTRRRVHTIRFAGDGTTWLNRPYSPYDFVTTLRDGDLLDGPDFPILWPL